MSILPLRRPSKQHLRIRPPNSSDRSHRRRNNIRKYLLTLASLAAYTIGIVILVLGAFYFGKNLGEYINSTDYDAVIVGAGWAGLKASQTLQDSGVSKILILEANGYVGGRAKSLNTNGSINSPDVIGDSRNIPTDMGCEWLYVNNAGMTRSLRSSGVIDPAFFDAGVERYSVDYYEAVYYDQSLNADGTIETKLAENITMSRLYENVWDRFIEEGTSRDGVSMADAVERFKRRSNLSSTEDHYLNLMKSIIEIEYAGDAAEVPSNKEIHLTSRALYTSIPSFGFGNIAAKYAEAFQPKLKLNANVVKVDYSEDQKNYVTYVQDGAATKISTDTVLVTVPLGVLKTNAIEFFPKLPRWKQEAIDNMGVGVLNKCIMYWRNPNDIVWPKDKFWFELMTPDVASSDRWTTFFNPSSFKGIPVLVGFISGQAAIDAENQTDDEILVDVMKNLMAMFPAIRKPDKIVTTRWGKEATARGSYAFKRVNRSWETDAWNLRRRIGTLWFAGEATHESPGSTVSAWSTGMTAGRSMASVLGN